MAFLANPGTFMVANIGGSLVKVQAVNAGDLGDDIEIEGRADTWPVSGTFTISSLATPLPGEVSLDGATASATFEAAGAALRGIAADTPFGLYEAPGNAAWVPVAGGREGVSERFSGNSFTVKFQLQLGVDGALPSSVNVRVRDFLDGLGKMPVTLQRITDTDQVSADWTTSGAPLAIGLSSAGDGTEQVLALTFDPAITDANFPCLAFLVVSTGGVNASPALPYQFLGFEVTY